MGDGGRAAVAVLMMLGAIGLGGSGATAQTGATSPAAPAPAASTPTASAPAAAATPTAAPTGASATAATPAAAAGDAQASAADPPWKADLVRLMKAEHGCDVGNLTFTAFTSGTKQMIFANVECQNLTRNFAVTRIGDAPFKVNR